MALLGACTSTLPSVDPDSSVTDASVDATQPDASASQGRNVLFVILDDIGADQIRSYARELGAIKRTNPSSIGIVDVNKNQIPDGLEDTDNDGQPDGAIATPTIDSLASAGVRFTQVWANPVCSPTRAGVYTGRYVVHHGIGSPLGDPNTVWALPYDVPTLPSLLKNEGSPYKTALFGKWHLGTIAGTLPTDRGWDYFSGALEGIVGDYYKWTKVVLDETGQHSSNSTEYVTIDNVNDALAWIGKTTDPWWVTVAFNASHTPYSEPPASCLSGKLTGKTDIDLFHKGLECADHEMGRLFDGISAATLANTTIFFMGDNGTEGPVSQVYDKDRTKSSTYQGGVHVPLIVADGATLKKSQSNSRVGSVTAPGRTVTSIVHSVDLFSTFAGIMGSAATTTDTVSMLPYLALASPTPTRTTAYTEAFRYQTADVAKLKASLKDDSQLTLEQTLALTRTGVRAAVRNDQYVLVYETTYKLYDLKNDPFQQTNLWCGAGEAKSQSETLAAAITAIDKSYPAGKCP